MNKDKKPQKRAYKEGDVDASRVAHDIYVAPEHHKKSGKYIKSMVYGGLDGIITTFAVVASTAGANFDIGVVIVLGVANLIADGISMGVGDFLSSQAEEAFARAESKRERWECENYLEGEQREMIELFEKKGFSTEDATTIIMIYSKYTDAFVDLMLIEELGIEPPDDDVWGPAKNGAVTFASFMVFGSIPLIFYIITLFFGLPTSGGVDITFILSAVATAVTLFTLGALKSRLTSEKWWKAGSLMLLNGGLAAGAAYGVGVALGAAVGTQA